MQVAACLGAISAEECLWMRMRRHSLGEAVAGENAQAGMHSGIIQTPSTPLHA